jgi:hypothetical protein
MHHASNKAAQTLILLNMGSLLEGVICVTQESTFRIEQIINRRVRTQLRQINYSVRSHQGRRPGWVLIIFGQVLRLSATNGARICRVMSLPSCPETIELAMEEEEQRI